MIFNSKKIRYVGCYFHFLQRIRRYLQKNGFTTHKNKDIYELIMNTCKKLPFINLIVKD